MIYAGNLRVYCDYTINGILDMELTAGEREHGRLTLRGRLAESKVKWHFLSCLWNQMR